VSLAQVNAVLRCLGGGSHITREDLSVELVTRLRASAMAGAGAEIALLSRALVLLGAGNSWAWTGPVLVEQTLRPLLSDSQQSLRKVVLMIYTLLARAALVGGDDVSPMRQSIEIALREERFTLFGDEARSC
jgi:hypothetical protein